MSDTSNSQTVSLVSMKDNTLYENLAGSVSNGAGQHFFSGKTSSGLIRRGLVAFDIAGNIPPCATITNVTLTLHVSRTISADEPVALHKVLEYWGEGNSDANGDEGGGAPAEQGDATWIHTFFDNNFWSDTGGVFSSTSSASITVNGIDFYNWGSTSQMVNDVQGWLNNPSSNYGWLLLGNESTFPSTKRFDSRQNDSVSFRPQLSVAYTLNLLALNLTSLIEGFWNGTSMVSDTVRIFLRNGSFPYPIVDSAKVKLTSSGNGIVCCNNASSGTYYIVVMHRNSIETWSKLPELFTVGILKNYNFTTAATQAFGDNLILKGGKYCIYSGDVNQEGSVDGSDLSIIDNEATAFLSGYVDGDLNGDEIVDGSDGSIGDNNASNFVSKVVP